ncbi:MAG TPA: DUF2948 family protein [Rhizomicrobium sp.]|nr:DUF2948 family protein [Rhizomicrobium sp.]
MISKELTLAAEDAEDIEVISARLQDAVTQVKDLVWLPKARRFVCLFNRFKWEAVAEKKRGNLRVKSRLYFNDVLSVRSQNIRRDAPDGVLSLLTIGFLPKAPDDPSGTVELVFAGGALIRLDVECIDAGLTDVSGAWAARGRPHHEKA